MLRYLFDASFSAFIFSDPEPCVYFKESWVIIEIRLSGSECRMRRLSDSNALLGLVD